MIDRPIRPLFPKGMLNEVQVVATVLSYDGKNDPDVLALTGASCALMISEIPFAGPIAGARVGIVDGELVLDPAAEEMAKSTLDLILVANDESVVMLEAGGDGITEDKMLEAIKFGHEKVKPLLEMQRELRKKAGKPKREDITISKINEELISRIKSGFGTKIKQVLLIKEKQKRIDELDNILSEIVKSEDPDKNKGMEAEIGMAFEEVEKQIVRDVILSDGKRIDGRAFDEIRSLSSEINILPRTHGSALFTRGETQALSVLTLGTASDEQRIDALEGETTRNFHAPLQFPSSASEKQADARTGRREIGHGALAAKAWLPCFGTGKFSLYHKAGLWNIGI
jgi:polyribonucleotide nucleotidyltransferase